MLVQSGRPVWANVTASRAPVIAGRVRRRIMAMAGAWLALLGADRLLAVPIVPKYRAGVCQPPSFGAQTLTGMPICIGSFNS